MANVFVERRQLSDGVALTWDIAHHLYTRQRNWPVVIVADQPSVMLAALRKQWLRVIAKLRKEYSSTVSQPRKQKISGIVAHMEGLRFTVRPDEPLGKAVYIMRPADARTGAAKGSQTIYATCPVTPDLEKVLMDSLQYYGLLMEYDFVGD